jgi:hypothetical protein
MDRLNANKIKTVVVAAAAGSMVVPVVQAEQAPAPTSPDNGDTTTVKPDRSRAHRRHQRHKFTGHVVKGRTSTFGWPAESDGQTADGGNTRRPCVALRDHSTLKHLFEVTVNHHTALLRQCDIGPAAWTGRNMDFTGEAAQRLHMNPHHYPTDIHGVARELQHHRR